MNISLETTLLPTSGAWVHYIQGSRVALNDRPTAVLGEDDLLVKVEKSGISEKANRVIGRNQAQGLSNGIDKSVHRLGADGA